MAGNAEDLFWTLFAFSSMVFLLPYLAMFPAFLKLRKIDADRVRPYRVPGGNKVATALVVLCMAFIVQAIVFFVWVPGEPIDWAFAGPVLGGVVLTLIVGEFLLMAAKKNKAN
jgi:amino acid transporter